MQRSDDFIKQRDKDILGSCKSGDGKTDLAALSFAEAASVEKRRKTGKKRDKTGKMNNQERQGRKGGSFASFLLPSQHPPHALNLLSPVFTRSIFLPPVSTRLISLSPGFARVIFTLPRLYFLNFPLPRLYSLNSPSLQSLLA